MTSAERITVRKEAVQTIERACNQFQEACDDRMSRDTLQKKYFWLGIIAEHELRLDDARENLLKARIIANEIDLNQVAFIDAVLKEIDSWALVLKRQREFKDISCEKIAESFDHSAHMFRDTKNVHFAEYAEGWRDFFYMACRSQK